MQLGLPCLYKRQAALCPLKANIASQLEVTALIGLVFAKRGLWSQSAQNAVLTGALARLPTASENDQTIPQGGLRNQLSDDSAEGLNSSKCYI